MNDREHENIQHHIADDEIDLVDIFLIVWKRKWMIVAVTVLLTIIATGISMMMPRIYAVNAIVETIQDEEGMSVESPQSIGESIVGGTYDRIISDNLNLKRDELPKFKVSIPKQTNLVKVLLESSEPEKAVNILSELLVLIQKNMAEKLSTPKKIIQNEIKASEIKKNITDEQIKQIGILVSVAEQRILEMEKSRKNSMLNRSSDAMTILLYLNEIQNKQIFLNALYQDVAELKETRAKADIAINGKKIRLASLKGVDIRKFPEISGKPIKPKKTLIIALAFFLGLMGGILVAFMAEFMNKVRRQQRAKVDHQS